MNIAGQTDHLVTSIARSSADILAAQKLRYAVFAHEFGANGSGVNHDEQIESDPFDAYADHLVLKDQSRQADDQIVGVYRLMRADHASKAGQFYSSSEFDLSPIINSSLVPLELSRSCIHPDYRGGTALLHLWQGLAGYVAENNVDVIFGVASFRGASADEHAACLALLAQDHLAPMHLRASAFPSGRAVPEQHQTFDRRSAMIQMPALIKAYLRMGGVVGEGAYVDAAFGTTDVCMILETAQLNARQRAFLGAAVDG